MSIIEAVKFIMTFALGWVSFAVVAEVLSLRKRVRILEDEARSRSISTSPTSGSDDKKTEDDGLEWRVQLLVDEIRDTHSSLRRRIEELERRSVEVDGVDGLGGGQL